MTITAVFVLFATIWFLVLFLCLQINIKTQGDMGEIVAGTHASSPINFDFKKRAIVTTLITIPLCALLSFSIAYGYLTRDMFDFLSVLEK
jgi:predicted secreted protein